jgi:hypothetical protein
VDGRECIVIDDEDDEGEEEEEEEEEPAATRYDSDDTYRYVEHSGPEFAWKLSAKTSFTQRTAPELARYLQAGPNAIIDWVQACAISPRGAKWIVGVGQLESIFIWRRRDVESTKSATQGTQSSEQSARSSGARGRRELYPYTGASPDEKGQIGRWAADIYRSAD